MDRATYEAVFEILLVLDECVDKAILQLEELEAMEEESLDLIDQLGGYCKAKECLNTPTARDEIKPLI